MVIKIPLPLDSNTDVLILELLDPSKIDLLCSKCKRRNDSGSFYCGWCGAQLSVKSKYTTQPLHQATYSIPEKDATITSIGLGDTNLDEFFCASSYEDSASPNEAYERILDDRCGNAMRQLVSLQNRLHYWYITAPTEEGYGMNDRRVQVLCEVRDMLKQYDEAIRILMAQEFKAKN
jgi:hypothetical protein